MITFNKSRSAIYPTWTTPQYTMHGQQVIKQSVIGQELGKDNTTTCISISEEGAGVVFSFLGLPSFVFILTPLFSFFQPHTSFLPKPCPPPHINMNGFIGNWIAVNYSPLGCKEMAFLLHSHQLRWELYLCCWSKWLNTPDSWNKPTADLQWWFSSTEVFYKTNSCT